MADLSKKIGAGTNYFLLILIILGFLFLINYLSVRHFTRVDLTETKMYSLSDSSKRMAAELNDIVAVKCYISKKLPPYLVDLKQKLNDILEEYTAYSKNNITIEFIDPTEDPALENKMRFMGIPQVQMNILEKDQATSTNVYMGIAVSYEDKQEVIPFVKDVNNFEYDLTNAILKVTREEKKTVGFLSGHGEHDIYRDYSTIRSALERQYAVETVDISNGNPVPSHINVLVVAGPEGLPERDKYEIDQFIMKGGRVFFLIDIITISEGTIQASYRDTNLTDLLEHYGVALGKHLVLDRVNTYITFQTGYTIIRSPYPFFPKVIEAGLDSEHPIVNQLESIVFPWATYLELLQDTSSEFHHTVLAQTSPYSWLQRGMYNLNPNQQFMPQKDDIKEYPLAMLVSGKFTSFYADKETPPLLEPEENEEQAAAQRGDSPSKPRKTVKECAEENYILVVSNAQFIADDYCNQPGNGEFFLNAVDWSTWGKGLIGIRSRKITDRPVPILTEHHKKAVKFANIMGIPILVALFGFARFYVKKKKKITLEKLR
ncbi:MAG: GldG family protein [Deltaproteobacteria bacterium]|nr:GldG family protein [Deltaproteobacteria bacterium]